MSKTPVDKEKCKGCGLCKKFCPVSAITLDEAKIPNASVENCIGCGRCVAVCPPKAIECTETAGQRSIWNRQFTILNCASCGTAFATEKEYEFAQKKAGNPLPAGPANCEICRRKKITDVFAAAFGERT